MFTRTLHLLVLILAMGTFACAGSVTFTWNDPDYGTIAVCGSTVTTACLSGFNLYDITRGRVKIATVPNPSGTLTPATAVTHTVAPYPGIGNSTVVATTTYVGSDGTPGESADSIPVSFTVRPAAPSGLSAR